MFKIPKVINISPKPFYSLPLLPLRDIVLFPFMMAPIFVGRVKSINALENAIEDDKEIFFSAQKNAHTDDPGEDDLYKIGTVGKIIQSMRMPEGSVKIFIEGKKRGIIKRFIPNPNFFQVDVEVFNEVQETGLEVEALVRNVKSEFETYIKLNKKLPSETFRLIDSITDPSQLADTIINYMILKLTDKQIILETENTGERLEKICGLIHAEIEIFHVEKKVKNRVRKQMEKTQKEYYLNEQMRAIQEEMGERDDFKNEFNELKEKINEKKMSEEATAKINSELKKLKMMPPMSAEATVVRNYIDWFISLPWYKKTEENYDLVEAVKILDEDHYGLREVKERIIEYLAVQSLVEKLKGPILCLVGPPGVGKTSLAKSVARATGRNFVRLSLGGVRDEAEIRGHRRTYIGALPGKIIQSMKKSGSANPIFLLDEVDKMSMDFRGDPSAALLEVLDPEQNHVFNDHYLDVDYDLSSVMFITTANNLPAIPPPLQDRMEVISIAGYTELEKFNIAEKFLVSKQREANGLKENNIGFTRNAILTIIRRYTREAGVRNLEREIASICRKVAKNIVEKGKDTRVKITSQNIQKYLGIPKFRYGKAEKNNGAGIATGLAWTEAGGELLTTEVAIMPGKGKLTVTGKLGDVMQESAQAALSYVRSRVKKFDLEKDFYQKIDLHIHVPEGAIPKDGPSAGVTMATAIVSALLKKPVRSDLAMTGEITLRGRILPIGGLKEKVLAAHRGNIKKVIIPKDNKKDIKDIPPGVLKSVNIMLADQMDVLLEEALVADDVICRDLPKRGMVV